MDWEQQWVICSPVALQILHQHQLLDQHCRTYREKSKWNDAMLIMTIMSCLEGTITWDDRNRCPTKIDIGSLWTPMFIDNCTWQAGPNGKCRSLGIIRICVQAILSVFTCVLYGCERWLSWRYWSHWSEQGVSNDGIQNSCDCFGCFAVFHMNTAAPDGSPKN